MSGFSNHALNPIYGSLSTSATTIAVVLCIDISKWLDQGNINSRNVHEGSVYSDNQFGITNSDWLLAPVHWSCRRAGTTIV